MTSNYIYPTNHGPPHIYPCRPLPLFPVILSVRQFENALYYFYKYKSIINIPAQDLFFSLKQELNISQL